MIVHRNKRLIAFCLALSLAVTFGAPPGQAAKGAKGYSVSAKSVIFSDATRVKRLYGKRVHHHILPASTTKVMTALLALERLPLDKVVTVSKRATSAEPSKLYLKPGERIKISELIYAILIKSANDASVVLAEAVAGSEEAFVKLMNKRARKAGARHTKFANASGLPSRERQYSTAYDIYCIFLDALKHPFFKKAVSYKYKTIRTEGGRKFRLKNHNKLLWKGWKKTIRGKTGWTRKAKACFVGYLTKGESTLVIAIFGCSRRWSDIEHIVSQYGGVSL